MHTCTYGLRRHIHGSPKQQRRVDILREALVSKHQSSNNVQKGRSYSCSTVLLTTESVETYTVAEYRKDIRGYNVAQSVHVEAVWPGDPVGETRWVCPTLGTGIVLYGATPPSRWLDGIADANPAGFPHGTPEPLFCSFCCCCCCSCFKLDSLSAIVGYADLSSSDLEDILQRHCESNRFRGIRHMLNFHPTKPQYSEPAHDNYLTDPTWIKGFGLLAKYGLSFDLHVLPHQMHRYLQPY